MVLTPESLEKYKLNFLINMKHLWLSLCLTTLFLSLSISLSANIAMPGFFGMGVGSDFEFVFQEEAHLQNYVRMRKENISIQLYQGYAVVRGEYWMQNLQDSTFNMHMGYPLGHLIRNLDNPRMYDTQEASRIQGLMVWVNGELVSIESTAVGESGENQAETENWQIWETLFSAGAETHIEVFFILETFKASVREGYNVSYSDGLIYLLESGQGWAGTIGDGRILIELKDGVKLEDIEGLEPDDKVMVHQDSARLLYAFTDLEPDWGHNIYMRYGEELDSLDLHKILNKQEQLLKAIRELNPAAENLSAYSSREFPPFYEVRGMEAVGGWVIGGFYYVLIFGPFVLLALLGWLIYKWWRKKYRG